MVQVAFRLPGNQRSYSGFTLIELLVTFAIVAIMLMLAAPSFVTFQRNSELTSVANTFVAAVSSARAEAIKRQLNTFVRPRQGNDWTQGWQVYVDSNWSGAYDASADVLVSTQDPLPSTITAQANAAFSTNFSDPNFYLMYTGAGYLQTRAQQMSIDPPAIKFISVNGSSRIVRFSPTGRISVCNPSGDATCTMTVSF